MGMDAISSKLIQERQGLIQRAEGIKQGAYEDNQRDLVDSERQALGNIQQRIRGIDEQLTLTTTDYQLNAETAARIAAFSGQQQLPQEGYQYRTAGEVLYDCLHQGSDRAARERFQSVMQAQTRAAEHMGTTAGATVAVAGGMPGLIITPVQGPVIDLDWNGMPAFQALNPAPATNPLGWSRPRIVDPFLDTAAGPQSGDKEKAELPSKHFDVTADEVKLTTLGNYLNISIQLESFVAGSLDIIVGQLNKRLSRGLEKAAVAELAKATKSITLPGTATATEFLAAIYDAAAMVFQATNQLPQWIMTGPLGWAAIGKVADLAGRPLFPAVGAVNAAGTSNPGSFGQGQVAGLPTVISPAITDTTMYVGNSAGIEAAVYRFPMLQAVEPSVMGRQIAVAASHGFYRPPTTEAGPGNVPPAAYEAIVKIAP